MPQNKSQQVKRVTITPLIFNGHEKKKQKMNKIFKNCVNFLKLKDMPLKGICITVNLFTKCFDTNDKEASNMINALG